MLEYLRRIINNKGKRVSQDDNQQIIEDLDIESYKEVLK